MKLFCICGSPVVTFGDLAAHSDCDKKPQKTKERCKTVRAKRPVQQAKVKIPRCPYDGDCDVSEKIHGVFYCERSAGVCNG
jgi:hypothetical protein